MKALDYPLPEHWQNFLCPPVSKAHRTGMSKLFPKWLIGCRLMLQPTNQAHAVWPIHCLQAQISWSNQSSLVCCCVVETETCSHTSICGIVWTSLCTYLQVGSILTCSSSLILGDLGVRETQTRIQSKDVQTFIQVVAIWGFCWFTFSFPIWNLCGELHF